jgi:hypothetical protein
MIAIEWCPGFVEAIGDHETTVTRVRDWRAERAGFFRQLDFELTLSIARELDAWYVETLNGGN